MTSSKMYQSLEISCFDSYELPLKDTSSGTSGTVNDDGEEYDPTSYHRPTLPSLSSLKRRRRMSSCSSTSIGSSSCGIHLSSLSLSSMSSNETFQCTNDSDHYGNVSSSLPCESFFSSEHDNQSRDYHHYSTSTDLNDDAHNDGDSACHSNNDEEDPAVGRLSKRHRASTNLTALYSSPSFAMMSSCNAVVDSCCDSRNSINNDYSCGSENDNNSDASSDAGWGFYVDTV